MTSNNASTGSRQGSSAPSVINRQTPVPASVSESQYEYNDAVSDDAMNEIIMAVDMQSRGTVGCAYYIAAEEKLYFMEDVELGGPDVVEARQYWPFASLFFADSNQVKIFIDPTVVLVSNKLDDAVLDKLDPERRNTGDGDSELQSS